MFGSKEEDSHQIIKRTFNKHFETEFYLYLRKFEYKIQTIFKFLKVIEFVHNNTTTKIAFG